MCLYLQSQCKVTLLADRRLAFVASKMLLRYSEETLFPDILSTDIFATSTYFYYWFWVVNLATFGEHSGWISCSRTEKQQIYRKEGRAVNFLRRFYRVPYLKMISAFASRYNRLRESFNKKTTFFLKNFKPPMYYHWSPRGHEWTFSLLLLIVRKNSWESFQDNLIKHCSSENFKLLCIFIGAHVAMNELLVYCF